MKFTQILLNKKASWSKSQITKHIYTLFSMQMEASQEGRYGLQGGAALKMSHRENQKLGQWTERGKI